MMNNREIERRRLVRNFEARINQMVRLGVKLNLFFLVIYGATLYGELNLRALDMRVECYVYTYNVVSLFSFLIAGALDEYAKIRDFFLLLGTGFLASVIVSFMLYQKLGDNELAIALICHCFVVVIPALLKLSHQRSLRNIPRNVPQNYQMFNPNMANQNEVLDNGIEDAFANIV